MKIVIADASCLILLTNLGQLDTLGKLYGDIWITKAVLAEYRLSLPSFISIKNPTDLAKFRDLLQTLDSGEASSIALALEHPGCKIVIDERKGRRIALSLGLDLTGTLGVLTDAAKSGLITIDVHLVKRLEEVGFYVSDQLKEEFLSGP